MATYAIGDIHGRLDLLRELVDRRLPAAADDTLVFIGDYVDRGPDSRGVIDYLIALSLRRRCVFLRGNHEAMFMAWLGLKAAGLPVASGAWLWFHGGAATLRSYGVPTVGARARWRLRRLRGRSDWLPAGHAGFLEATRLFYEDEHACYVHAGLRRDVPLEEQSPGDLLMAREGWIDGGGALDKVVVHGHTPTPMDGGELAVRVLPHRINLDTGSGRHPNGFLSAIRLPDRAVFAARPDRL